MATKEGQQRHRDRKAPGCHCRGERLVMIIGNARDRTIAAAKQWVRRLTNVGRSVWFSSAAGATASMNSPYILSGNDWARFQPQPGSNGNTAQWAATFQDFCFFEEIMVMAHGSQVGLWRDLLTTLATVIYGRSVRKLTLWVCESSHAIYPGNPNNQRYYERLCGLVTPRKCPCGCDLALCSAKAIHPDGDHPPGYRCPAADECTTLYFAAWYEHPRPGGTTWTLPSKLGLDLAPTNNGQPLTSPDGRVRKVTICPGAAAGSFTITARVMSGADVFAGFRVRTDTGLYETNPHYSDRIQPDRRLRDAAPRPPATPIPYSGPTACATLDGCLREGPH